MNVFKLAGDRFTLYVDGLIDRFGQGSSQARTYAKSAAHNAEKKGAELESAAGSLPADGPARKEVAESAAVVRSAGQALENLVEKWDAQGGPTNSAAEYVQRALDLQVGKSGGLLAYNGLALAVATMLWSTRALPSTWSALQYAVFALLFFSSILSLTSIRVRWPDHTTTSTARTDLEESIRLAYRRARTINIAIILAIVGTLATALWIGRSGEKQSPVIVAQPVRLEDGAALSISLVDTLHLRCGPSIMAGRVRSRDISCLLVRQ